MCLLHVKYPTYPSRWAPGYLAIEWSKKIRGDSRTLRFTLGCCCFFCLLLKIGKSLPLSKVQYILIAPRIDQEMAPVRALKDGMAEMERVRSEHGSLTVKRMSYCMIRMFGVLHGLWQYSTKTNMLQMRFGKIERILSEIWQIVGIVLPRQSMPTWA